MSVYSVFSVNRVDMLGNVLGRHVFGRRVARVNADTSELDVARQCRHYLQSNYRKYALNECKTQHDIDEDSLIIHKAHVADKDEADKLKRSIQFTFDNEKQLDKQIERTKSFDNATTAKLQTRYNSTQIAKHSAKSQELLAAISKPTADAA